MTAEVADYSIEEIDLENLSADELDEAVVLVNRIGAEREPRHSDLSPEEFLVFSNFPGSVRRRLGVYEPGRHLLAMSQLSYPDDGSNAHLLRVDISVLPEHRRNGIASHLLASAVEIAADLGRSKLSGHVFDTVPAGSEFATAIGALPTLDFHSNALRITDLDLDLLRGWIKDGPERASGYSVRIVDGMYPDHLLVGMAHLYHVLERDMPTPEGHEPRVYTPELVKQFVGQFLAASDIVTSVAIHDETLQVAGMSQLVRRHTDPKTWFVSTTMVDPDHRGQALGKWLKGAVNLEALERWPEGIWQETGNAFTNDAMLGINHAMGFEHEYTMTDVEVEVEQAQRYLASRSI